MYMFAVWGLLPFCLVMIDGQTYVQTDIQTDTTLWKEPGTRIAQSTPTHFSSPVTLTFHHHHRVARPSESIAVSTSWRHFERSCARIHAVLRPRLWGRRSISIVRSHVRLGRPARRRQSTLTFGDQKSQLQHSSSMSSCVQTQATDHFGVIAR